MRLALYVPLGLFFLLSAPALHAQCIGAADFASIGGMMSAQKLLVETGPALNAGLEIGRFWEATDSNHGNNFSGGCPSSNPSDPVGPWWRDEGDGLRGVFGSINGSTCVANSCPDDLIMLVEDWGPSGPPGVGEGAYFIATRVPRGAAGSAIVRAWDIAIVDDAIHGQADSVVPMIEIPQPVPISSSGGGVNTVEVVFELPDIAAGVWAVDVQGQPLPASSVVAGYDLFVVTNTAQDPGRSREAWGTPVDQQPYLDAPGASTLEVQCSGPGGNTYVALGLRFDGGDGLDVPAALVSRPVEIECGFGVPPDPAGEIASLSIGRQADAGLQLEWTPSCLGNDLTYAVYEGELGDFAGHVPLACGTGGQTSFTVPEADGSTYYLVVAISGGLGGPINPREGSYGRTSAGAERPPSAIACLLQERGVCP